MMTQQPCESTSSSTSLTNLRTFNGFPLRNPRQEQRQSDVCVRITSKFYGTGTQGRASTNPALAKLPCMTEFLRRNRCQCRNTITKTAPGAYTIVVCSEKQAGSYFNNTDSHTPSFKVAFGEASAIILVVSQSTR